MASVPELITAYAKAEGYRVEVKTNLGPGLEVYNARTPDKKSVLADLLQMGVRVIDERGRTVAAYGGYPQTNPLIAGGLMLGAGLLLFTLGRGLVK